MSPASEKKLRVGIAGYGVVGQRRHHFINEDPRMEVIGISDLLFSTDLGTPGEKDGVPRYRKYQDLLDQKPDLFFVCLPNHEAPRATITGLESGCHVFCEKPPGKTVADILKVRSVEAKHPSLKLKYGFNHRYHDSVREALKLVQSEKLGRVINMRGVYGKSAVINWPRPLPPGHPETGKHWRTDRKIAGGGILLDQGIHMVDLMRAFAGEFTNVKSFVKNDFWKHDVEDNAYALLESESGIVAMLHSTATQWKHRFSLEIFLSEGAVILSGILSGTKSYGQETLTVLYREENDGGNPKEQTTTYIRDPSWKDEITEFVDAVQSNTPIKVGSSLDALKSMELVYKIYSSDEHWREKFKITSNFYYDSN